LESFGYNPKISILVPVYNTNAKFIISCIESVINQIYTNWELCIVDGNSSKPYIKNILQRYTEQDNRIKTSFLKENKGIAGNSNEALGLATGDFVGFLDHDDELHPCALYEVVKLLNARRDIDFVYTDEDKISARGKRFAPHFKPDWAPDTFRSYNYICHLTVTRKSVIDATGGLRTEYEGSQDYDLFLRVSEKTERIAHIPKVLYHWRAHEYSVASDARTKMYAYESAKKALSDHIRRLGLKGEVHFARSLGRYRIRYDIDNESAVSIIIPTRDNPEILKRCVNSVLNKSTYAHYEILIVDNKNTEEETSNFYRILSNNPRIKILNYDKSFNFSAINNYAVSMTDSEYLIFLNNDTEVISPSWIESMLEFAQRDEVGVVGAKLYYPNNTIQHAGIIIQDRGIPRHAFRNSQKKQAGYMSRAEIIQNYSAVTGACMMTKKCIFDEIGGFDEDFAFNFNDVDFCLNVRQKDYLIVWTPYAELYHHESKTRGNETLMIKKERYEKELALFRNKWKNFFESGDPYYNPNLSSRKVDFSFNIK